MPGVVGLGEGVFYCVGNVGGEIEDVEIEGDHCGLGVDWVEVDYDEDGVAVVGRGFGVGEEIVVGGGVEVEVFVALEGWVVAADVVEVGDQRGDGVGVGAVPGAELIFFAVEIFFAAGLAGGGFGWAAF